MINKKEEELFLEQFDCAFFVGNLDTGVIDFANKKARETYGKIERFAQLSAIFQNPETYTKESMYKRLEDHGESLTYQVSSKNALGQPEFVDLHVGFFQKENSRIYIEILPKRQLPMTSLETIVDDLRKATMVTELDLSLVYQNKTAELLFQMEKGENIVAHFLPHQREELFLQIAEKLKTEKNFYIQMEMLDGENNEGWYALDFQCHQLEGHAEKLIIVASCIEEQMEREEKLQDINSYFNILQTLTKGLLYRLDVNKRILYRNEETARQYGISSVVTHYPNRAHLEEVFHPDDIEDYVAFIERTLEGNEGNHTARMISPSGQFEYHEITFRQLAHPNGSLKEMIGTAINVNEMKETEDKLAVVNQYFNIIQSLSNDLLYRFDIQKGILYRNEQTARFYQIESVEKNYPQKEKLVGVFHPDDIDDYVEYIESVRRGIEGSHSSRMMAPSGDYEYHKIHFKKVLNSDGTVKEMIGKAVNVQDLVDLETKASYDMLTGVLNKASFQEQVSHIINHSALQHRHALFFIDLDGFKGVNDTLGHSFGDFLLKTVGERLKKVVRGHDLIGRVGGDEFVVFLESCGDALQLKRRADFMLSALREAYEQDGVTASARGSIGIAVFPQDGTNYEILYENADKALYQSKEKGKDIATLYSE